MQQNKNITGECKQNLKLCKRRGLPMQELWDVIAKVLPTTYKLDANGEEDEDLSLPAPNSYQGDNEGDNEATGIAPVIHTIDRDGTERWFDLNGRQLEGKPTKKGVYINKGNKVVIK